MLREAIKASSDVKKVPTGTKHVRGTHSIQGYRDGQCVIYARFNKNDQLCDIQPRNIPEVSGLFTQYVGRPYTLIEDELRLTFKDFIENEYV